jgi:hypothetical protein
MSILLQQLMSKAKKPDIGFGINEDCVLLEASNVERTTKDGGVLGRSCYLKFGQKNAKGDVFKHKEVNWFLVDPSTEWAYTSFFSQLEQVSAVVDLILPPTAEKDSWGLVFAHILDSQGIDQNEKSLREAMVDAKVCVAFNLALWNAVCEVLTATLAENPSPVFKLKLVYDKSGKYLQQPREGVFVSTTVDKETLFLTDAEVLAKNIGENTQTAVAGATPSAAL